MMETMPFANIQFFGGRYPLFPSEPKLQKKIMWLAKCMYHPTGSIYHIMHWRRRRSYFFFKSSSGVKEVVIFGQIRWTIDWTALPVCYYLGSYPFYWDTQTKSMVSAGVRNVKTSYIFGKKPDHPDAPGWKITKEAALQYQKDFPGSIYDQIVRQYEFIEKMDSQINACIRKNYDPDKYKKSRIIKTPTGDQEWPGIEWPWMKQPPLTTPPSKEPKRGRMKLIIEMSFTSPTRMDGLNIKLEYYELWPTL